MASTVGAIKGSGRRPISPSVPTAPERRPDVVPAVQNVCLGDVAAAAELIAGATPCGDVDQRFNERPELSCVVVTDAAGGRHVLTRRSFSLEMAGRLGFGRMLHGDRPVIELASRRQTLALPAQMRLVAAGRAALARPVGRRYDDVLVDDADGSCATVSVADLFTRLALVHEHRALHDALTGLANRAAFDEAVERALTGSRAPTRGRSAVLFVDLDDFKAINDSLGHAVGDELIVTLAGRLCQAFRTGDLVARLGGDEFAVLLVDCDEEMARTAADRVRLLVAQPMIVGSRSVQMGASVGVAMSDRSDGSPGALLRNADLAMYDAKRAGKGRNAVYRPVLHASAVSRFELFTDLSGAVERGEMRLVYQPVVALDSEEIWGVEALLRWQHPRRGVIAPLEFIPLAESSGAIQTIGAWVLREACLQVARWQPHRLGQTPLHLGVNVSVRQLEAPGFTDAVASALTESGLAAEQLTLEITESALTAAEDTVSAVLASLRDTGVALAIDDFGTGYSSFARLDGLPVGTLKIDRSFLARLEQTGSDAVLRGMVGLARAMGVDTIVEGVETADQAAVMRRLGYRLAQGYHFARPLDADGLGRRLRGERTMS